MIRLAIQRTGLVVASVQQAKMVFLKNSFSRRYSKFFDKLAL